MFGPPASWAARLDDTPRRPAPVLGVGVASRDQEQEDRRERQLMKRS